MKNISRAVWILSLVSLFTDTASEMLYPIMPIYLKTIGFSVLLIGILEGFAEATAGLSKGYFGKLSDQTGKRVPFVQAGYAMSAASKPMMAILIHPVWVFFARTIDRFGKGVRTGARDALLSDEATVESKGAIFGFHRSMDTLGAVLGPSLALIYLYYHPQDFKTLFMLAFIPGLLAILATSFLKESTSAKPVHKQSLNFFKFFDYWKESPTTYKKLIGGLLVFTLFNSSDVFLLLKAKQSGLDETMIIGVYIFYNLVYALFSFPLGKLADKVGLQKMLMFGLGVYAFVYLGMAFQSNLLEIAVLFFLYGIYAAATEGVSKALISNVVDKEDTATAIGTYTGFQSICAMLASSLAGLIWFLSGPSLTFVITSVSAIAVILYFAWVMKPGKKFS